MTTASAATHEPQLARRLGLFDATMIVMGGIIGSGIFINPYVVARQVHSQLLILGVWALGGLLALAAAFIWAELASRRPDVGGQYAYLREAFHPSVAFLYGWVLLLVIQTGGMIGMCSKPDVSSASRIDATCPSIIADGATTSAPASA